MEKENTVEYDLDKTITMDELLSLVKEDIHNHVIAQHLFF